MLTAATAPRCPLLTSPHLTAPRALATLQSVCARQNVTVTLYAATQLTNGTTVYHSFNMQQAQGTVFNSITVTHLADPVQVRCEVWGARDEGMGGAHMSQAAHARPRRMHAATHARMHVCDPAVQPIRLAAQRNDNDRKDAAMRWLPLHGVRVRVCACSCG